MNKSIKTQTKAKKTVQAKEEVLPHESKSTQVDLHYHSTWDDDDGILISLDGVRKLLNAAQDEADLGWQFDSVETDIDDDSLFHLSFSRVLR